MESAAQQYQVITASSKVTVPVLSTMAGDIKIIAHLHGGEIVTAVSVDAQWLRVELPHNQAGYIPLGSVMPFDANTPIPANATPPLVRQSFGRDLPGMGLAFLLIVGGGVVAFFGLIAVLLFMQTCFYVNGVETGCSEQSFPFQATGVVMIVGGLLTIIIGWLVSRSVRSQFRR